MRLSERELASRGALIQQLLRPISRRPTGPAWSRLSVGTSHLIIGTHDESRSSSHYRDWRFAVDAANYYAMYFEDWRSETRNSFILNKAYLNIYVRSERSEREVVCLHCDPSLSPEEEHARYKRGPHIHMSIAGSPYDSAHIALQGPDLAPVLKSTETLHNALAWGVEMIRDEILNAIS